VAILGFVLGSKGKFSGLYVNLDWHFVDAGGLSYFLSVDCVGWYGETWYFWIRLCV